MISLNQKKIEVKCSAKSASLSTLHRPATAVRHFANYASWVVYL